MKRAFFLCALFLGLLPLAFGDDSLLADGELLPERIGAYSEFSTQIVVQTRQAKCFVYLNDVLQGRSNLTLNGMAEGQYRLRVEKGGFAPKRETISVVRGESRTFYVELDPEKSPDGENP